MSKLNSIQLANISQDNVSDTIPSSIYKNGQMGSQTLFDVSEQLAAEKGQLKALINQSRMSTYYQDNPFGVLSFSNKFGIDTLGGPIDGSVGSGHRPGYKFNAPEIPNMQMKPTFEKVKIVDKKGIVVPKSMSSFKTA